RRAGKPGAELFAFKNSGRVVFDPFTDHDFAANVHEVEHAAHRVAGGRVGGFLVSAAEPTERIQRRGFGRADEIELNDAFDVVITDFWEAMHERANFPTSRRNDNGSSLAALCERRINSADSHRPPLQPNEILKVSSSACES